MVPVLTLSVLFLSSFPISSSSLLSVIILAGQSNMSGRGGANTTAWDHVVPPECSPAPSILRLSSKLQWEQAQEPLHQDIDTDNICGTGPGMPFANAVLHERPGTQLGLVPCAVGATTIDQWAKGTSLYNAMIARAKAATSRGEISAVLWYQGESNTFKAEDAQTYTAKVEKMITDLRTDLGQPDLLFIQVAIATGQGPYVEPIRAAQKAVDLPNVVTVDAMGCQISQDYVHLSTPGQVRLGSILAKAYLQATH